MPAAAVERWLTSSSMLTQITTATVHSHHQTSVASKSCLPDASFYLFFRIRRKTRRNLHSPTHFDATSTGQRSNPNENTNRRGREKKEKRNEINK